MFAENTHNDSRPDLRGKRILLVEDEFYIANDVARLLRELGAQVVGPVSTVEAAEKRIDKGDFDCAVLDLNLHGESAIGVVDRISATGRSFIIATGYGSPSVPERLRHAPRIEKPSPRRCWT